MVCDKVASRILASGDFPLQRIEGAMPATTSAAVSAALVELCGENDRPAFQIEIAGAGGGQGTRPRRGEIGGDDTTAADAGDVARVFWDTAEQFGRKVLLGAPARAFVGVGAGRLAIIGAPAERALAGRVGHGGDYTGFVARCHLFRRWMALVGRRNPVDARPTRRVFGHGRMNLSSVVSQNEKEFAPG